MPTEVPLIIIGMILLGLCFRLLAGSFDKQRITDYASGQGWDIISINWNPFGRGWFGSQNERFYSVTYKDRNGTVFSSTCKTSMMAGVYFSNVQQINSSSRALSSPRLDCPRCGKLLSADARFCSNCGTPLHTSLE